MNVEVKKRIENIKKHIVPEGYKLTKVGIIPEKWEVINMNKISKRIQRRNDGASHPVLTISSLGGFLDQSERFSKVIAGDNLKKYTLLKKNEFSYNKGNSKTYPYGCIFKLEDYDTAVIPNVYYSFDIPNDSKEYYEQYFSLGKLNKQLSKVINTGVRNDGLLNLNADDFFKCLVIRPALLEQQKIATILSTWDKAIELKEKLIQQKKEQKRGLMQKLLTGEVRLLGFEGEWKEVRLGDICEINKGTQLNKLDMIENGAYPALNGGITLSGYTNKWNTEKDTITISEGGNSCGYVNYITKRFWCGGHCYSINPKSEVIKKLYLYHLLKYNEKPIMNLRVGSGLPNIQKKSLSDLFLEIPNLLNEQEAIASVLSIDDEEISLLEQELSALKLQKKGLMQLLLTGIIRVVNKG